MFPSYSDWNMSGIYTERKYKQIILSKGVISLKGRYRIAV
jgi:hypothetical protein